MASRPGSCRYERLQAGSKAFRTIIMNLTQWKTRARNFGFAALLGSYLVLMYIFFQAYIHPDMIVGLRINRYGEANIELIMYLISIPSVICYLRTKTNTK